MLPASISWVFALLSMCSWRGAMPCSTLEALPNPVFSPQVKWLGALRCLLFSLCAAFPPPASPCPLGSRIPAVPPHLRLPAACQSLLHPSLRDEVLSQLLTVLALIKGCRFSDNDCSPLPIFYWYFRHFGVYKHFFQQLIRDTVRRRKLIQPWNLLRKVYSGAGGWNAFSLISFVITKSTVNIKTWVSIRPWHMPLRFSW